jgi:hypothetical protein
MPRIYLSGSDLSRPRQGRGRGTAWYVWISIDHSETADWRLASFRPLCATTPSSRKFVIRSIPISDCSGQWPVWNRAAFVMDGEKLIVLVQGHQCLCKLQHKDYNNNLVKDIYWKERAGELHAQDKELSRRTQHCQRMAVAVVAGSWQGNGMVCVNRPLTR